VRTSTDVLRSLVVYLSQSLGDEWEIRPADEEGAFDRPFCKVAAATPMSVRPQGTVVMECSQTFAVVCYPVETDSPLEARMEAERVVELLYQAFLIGTHAASYGRQHNIGLPDKAWRRGHPMRIPLYDFDGIGLHEPVSELDRDSRDFISVTEPPTFGPLEGTARSEEEETLYVVTGELRCRWVRSGAVVEDAVPVEEVRLNVEAP
jgi:hypothetical protein